MPYSCVHIAHQAKDDNLAALMTSIAFEESFDLSVSCGRPGSQLRASTGDICEGKNLCPKRSWMLYKTWNRL